MQNMCRKDWNSGICFVHNCYYTESNIICMEFWICFQSHDLVSRVADKNIFYWINLLQLFFFHLFSLPLFVNLLSCFCKTSGITCWTLSWYSSLMDDSPWSLSPGDLNLPFEGMTPVACHFQGHGIDWTD